MRHQSNVSLLLSRCTVWQRQSLLSNLQRDICCAFYSAHQGKQHADAQMCRADVEACSGSCAHRLKFMETLLAEAVVSYGAQGSRSSGQCSDRNVTAYICHHGCYPKPFNTFTLVEPASFSGSSTCNKTSSKISLFGGMPLLKHSSSFIDFPAQSRRFCSGLWSQRRRDPLCTGRRSVHRSLRDLEFVAFEDSACGVPASNEEAVDIPKSDEDFDFRNFPALKSSFFQDYNRPGEMELKRRVTWQTNRKLFNKDSNLTEESIPKPKGRTYDFGLGGGQLKPPPLEAGARPQGGFDINIFLDECEAVSSEAPISSLTCAQKMPSRNLPWDTPEADNWSKTNTDSQKDENSAGKAEQEFCWDPYDFDADTKLLHKMEIEESLSVNVASQ